jgi:hypothetical protein
MRARQKRWKLKEAVAAFLAEHGEHWDTPEKAHGACAIASYDFRDFLTGRGLDSEVWDITIGEQHDSYICPMYPKVLGPDAYDGHCVVFVKGVSVLGTVVDWTARQYNPDAPYPLVFTPRFGGDRRRYWLWRKRRES